MPEFLERGAQFAHVLGEFNLEAGEGHIASVTPVGFQMAREGEIVPSVWLKGFNSEHDATFNLPVHALIPSCGPTGSFQRFDEFAPLSPQLHSIELWLADQSIAQFVPTNLLSAQATARFTVERSRDNRHIARLVANTPGRSGTNYTVQVRPSGETRWHTIAAQLVDPNLDVDARQFPGAQNLEVRVLRIHGFSKTQIFQTNINLTSE